VAIALPLDLEKQEVFLSYNFEASYDLPRTWKKKPPYLVRFHPEIIMKIKNQFSLFSEMEMVLMMIVC